MLLIIVRSVHMRKSFLLAFIMQIVDKSMTSISICFEHAQQANQLCIYVNFQRWHDVGKYSDADPSIVCGIEFTVKTC